MGWCIGTIISINKESKYFTAHYDGFSSIYDESISFDAASLSSKIRKLHTMTPHHQYETNKNCKPCAHSKYNECIICTKRYCTKCMFEYIQNNECKDCRNAQSKNKWITKLKKGNQCDVYLYGYCGILSNNQWHNGWHIATVCDIQSINSHLKMKLSVHFNGFESEYDECIDADLSSKTLCFKLNRLNKYSVHHTYLSNNDDKKVCVAINEWKKCSICQRKYCQKCMPPGIELNDGGYQCNECGPKQERERLFEAIESALICRYKEAMQQNIICIIFNYSLGVTVRCCNEWNCLNEINFSSQFEMELNAQQNIKKKEVAIFQYYIHCNQTMNVTPNVLLFGKKRRIFCEDCSEFELGNCIQCNARTEADGIDGTLKCQKCLDAELKKEQNAILEFKRQQNKIKKEQEKKKENLAKLLSKVPDIDSNFVRFKDEIYPQIAITGRRNQNKQNLVNVLNINGMHFENLPYCLWSEQCNLIPNCRRSYCAYYHNSKEKEFGQILYKMTKDAKSDKYVMRRKEFHYYQNQDLMDYGFNIQYVQDKMSKKREKI